GAGGREEGERPAETAVLVVILDIPWISWVGGVSDIPWISWVVAGRTTLDFRGGPTLDFRGGILFFLPLLPLPSFPLPQHVAAVVGKVRAVPFEVILRRQHQGVAVAAAGPFCFSQPPMRRLALAIDAEAAGLGHNHEAVMLKLTEPAADAVGGAAHFLHSVQVRQEDAAVVLLLEAPPALEMHIEPARAVRCCAPRGRVHHFEVDGHERREPALILARAHDTRSRDASQAR